MPRRGVCVTFMVLATTRSPARTTPACFGSAGPFPATVFLPFLESSRFSSGPRLENGDLRRAAYETLTRHLRRRPKRNPWIKFGERLATDLPRLLSSAEAHYHAYAFATVRQCGAAFELARSFVEWLSDSRTD